MPFDKMLPIQDGSTIGEDPVFRLLQDIFGTGVVGETDMQVLQYSGGARMSAMVDIGDAYVPITSGGVRRVRNTAKSDSGTIGNPTAPDWLTTFTAADGTNPRIDRVVVTARDNTIDGTGAYGPVLRVIAGTPTAGATTTNLNGAAAVPANSVLLANVLIPAGATTVTTANIDTTVRARAKVGAGSAPGGMTQLYDSTLGGSSASFDITGISSAYNHLRLICFLRSDRAAVSDGIAIRFNNSTGNYYEQIVQSNAAGAATSIEGLNKTAIGVAANGPWCSGANALAGCFASLEMLVPNYRNASLSGSLAGTWSNMTQLNTGTGTLFFLQGGYSWAVNSIPLTRITVFPVIGASWIAGSRVTLLGS